MRSLTFKLIIAFVLTSAIGIGLAALVARLVTASEFGRFVMEQQRSEFIAMTTDYYAARGSWAGAGEYVNRLTEPQQPGAARRPPQFVLADQNGVVVTPAQGFRVGDRLEPQTLAVGAPIHVAGRRVGTVIDAARLPALSQRELRYLASTNQALSVAALGAAALALLAGVFLASNLTRPLRDLTQAIQAMARGELKQQVPVRSGDELGALTQAFNQLSADVARSNELRRQMTADIAHDLRTPLSVIRAYIDGLREGVFKPTPERLEAMHLEAQHLQRLIDDLRTLSLADAGELPMHPTAVAPQALLERLAASYAPQVQSKDISLQVSCEPNLPEICADTERLIQVLGNLVSNSLRYTPAGGRIVLSAGRQGDDVFLAVRDNGAGIAPEALPYVFDRFYRSDPARSQQESESGLGLAIAKSIVEAHAGRINVESAPGNGTTVTLWLPSAS